MQTKPDHPFRSNDFLRTSVFAIAFIGCLTPFASPPLALAAGMVLSLTLGNPVAAFTSKATKILLQICVVGLGFGMNIGTVIQAGSSGVLFTIASVAGTLGLGVLIGKWMKIERTIAYLISCGTAICGGSAIAAIGPVVKADTEQMSVSLATIFMLNSVALLIFPPIGHWLHLTETQFGLWAAIAIHDTSSVVGAAARYGNEALQIATTVKLTRALWIVPVAVITSFFFKNASSEQSSAPSKISVPYFILLFVLASLVRTWFPVFDTIYASIVNLSKTGLVATLFLIGAGLSKQTLKSVGVKPLVQGVVLWIVISLASLWVVLAS